jgi:hypothetical protein
MMATALIVVAHGLSGAAALAVNCVLWFILILMAFRQLGRDRVNDWPHHQSWRSLAPARCDGPFAHRGRRNKVNFAARGLFSLDIRHSEQAMLALNNLLAGTALPLLTLPAYASDAQ